MGAYILPYLRPPDVPGASRCLLTFTSQEVLDLEDRYRGKKRYRFNKWRPVSPSFPRLHSSGLIFGAHQDQPLMGIISPWTIPYDDTGFVRFLFRPVDIQTWNQTNDHLSIVVGFSRYSHSKYWGIEEGLEFMCRRTIDNNMEFDFYSLRIQHVDGPYKFDPLSAFSFTLRYSPTELEIEYQESNYLTGAVGLTRVSRIAHDPNVDYRVVMYCYNGDHPAAFTVPLVSSEISFPNLQLIGQERIYFLENPSTFAPPMGHLRDNGLRIYAKPYKAFIEDAEIVVASEYVPEMWVRTLDFLVTGSLEPLIFTDPDGFQWLVCFKSLIANSSIRTNSNESLGYELIMPVVVAH